MEQFKNINPNFDYLISNLDKIRTKKDKQIYLNQFTGTLSAPSKMPCSSYNIPAIYCKIGALLNKIENSVCHDCYALKGRYIFPNVFEAMKNRYDNMLNNPYWIEAMALQIALFNKGDKKYFRWHDSGDLQSIDHFDKIVKIAQYLPNVNFWLPTREYKIISDWVKENMVDDFSTTIPENLVIRFSAHMIDSIKEVKNKTSRSIVASSEQIAKEFNSTICHATKKDGSHKCESCRLCWKQGTSIAYLLH